MPCVNKSLHVTGEVFHQLLFSPVWMISERKQHHKDTEAISIHQNKRTDHQPDKPKGELHMAP
jgi:hypothetical protein